MVYDWRFLLVRYGCRGGMGAEEEIKKLGVHRGETLGYKLQIRHFRSSPSDWLRRGDQRDTQGVDLFGRIECWSVVRCGAGPILGGASLGF